MCSRDYREKYLFVANLQNESGYDPDLSQKTFNIEKYV